MSTYIQHVKRYPLSLICAVAILILSLMPAPHIELAEDVPLADKWTHMVMYGSLVLLIWIEYLRSHRNIKTWRLLCFGVVCPILMGGALEIMQSILTTTRSGDWWDFVANSIGVLIAAFTGYWISFFHKQNGLRRKWEL